MATTLVISSKMATLDLLKRKLFWNKVYDIIVSVYDVIDKVLPGESNYIVDAVK